ncbi:MAG: hypothetical protein R2991_10060 [Thermoanaerobaculia bacterium]
MSTTPRRPETLRIALLATLLLLPMGRAAAARDTLTLRVHDAIALPGGRAAVVLRTYSPRPVGVGQICFRAGAPAGGPATGPFAALESWTVFPEGEDVLSDVTVRQGPGGMEILVDFESLSAAVNRFDGPLAVFFFQVSDDVQVGQKFELSLDLPNTTLFDASGQAIDIEPRPGKLEIRSPAERYLAAFEGDEIEPGEIAELELQTYEPFEVASAHLLLRYRKRLAGGSPVVRVDKRHGRRMVEIDTTRSGRIAIDLSSPDASFNTVPGGIVTIALPTRGDARGSYPVKVIRRRSFLVDAEGQTLPVRFQKGRVVVRPRPN